jgi:hypothetical protein
MSTQEKKPQKLIFPDQLNIIIRTSVPGFQRIEYKPSMTIKDSDEKGVKFNPLIKLHQSTINKIPQEYRIKQFFNKGLFQSLLNYNGGTPAKNLFQATRNGYVDNNINVTLNSIFPTGSVIYIGKNPYVIADHQWTTGDWKIDVKQKKQEIDPNKVVDPQLYSQLVRDEIISGEEELSQLPESIIVGNNYSGPPVAQGRKIPAAAAPPTPPPPPPPPPPAGPPVVPPAGPPPAGPPPAGPPPAGPPPAGPPRGLPPAEQPIEEELAPAPPDRRVAWPPIPRQPPRQITLPDAEQPEKAEELSPEEERLFENFKEDLRFSIRSSQFFRDYFKTDTYKKIAKAIFNKFPYNSKTEMKAFYSYTTNAEPRVKTEGLSNALYEKLCNQVAILQSPQDGDCFFRAVADGINIYNYENQGSKIHRGIYGKTQLYTTMIIRELVLEYIQGLGDTIINNMLVIAEEQVERLNISFNDAIEELKGNLGVTELTPEQYLSELNNTYFSNPNFLIYNPGRSPVEVDKYNTPFRVLKKNEINDYIMSKNYWANDIAIEAVCSKLNICIIPIEKYNYQRKSGKVRIKTTIVNRLKALLLNKTLVDEKCSNKIMFLFYQNNHYELIRFTYNIKPVIKTFGQGLRQHTEYDKKWFTIFKSKDLPPPFHILILLYGTIYSTLDPLSKTEYKFFTYANDKINSSVLKISRTPHWLEFKTNFDDIFPNRDSIDTRIIRDDEISIYQDKNGDGNQPRRIAITGGDGPNYQYNPNYRQPYPFMDSRPMYITKKPDEQGTSKIAYTITIDMEVHPGTSLTSEQMSQSKCNSRYNAIRKAFSEFTGRPYVIPPVYPESKNTTKKKLVENKGGKRKTRKNI